VISTPAADAPAIEVAAIDRAPAQEPAVPESVSSAIGEIAQWVVTAVQPNSDVRHAASGKMISRRIGEAAGTGISHAEIAVGQIATSLASVLQMQPQPRPFLAPPAEKLVAEAILETPRPVAEAPEPAEIAVVDVSDSGPIEPVAEAQATRLMQIELACNAALEVVKQQAARNAAHDLPAADVATSPNTDVESSEIASVDAAESDKAAEADQPADELVRAQAVATACDIAAESLEKLAMTLRRAGDSLVRQAKANGGAKGTLLR
jgi:hypothetical protein